MKETSFTAVLARIGFPLHVATYRAAIKGHPLSKGRWLTRPMEKEDALRLSMMCMWHMLLRRWEKFNKP